MKIKTVYGFIPVPVFIAKDLGWAAGRAYGVFVRIKEKYKDDEGLLQHELQHIRQFYRTLMLHPLLYKFSARYRYNAELECYRVQLRYAKNKDRTLKYFVKLLTTRYGLKLDAKSVENDLRK